VIGESEPGELNVVDLHDGSRLKLRKVEEDYDPTDRAKAAMRLMDAAEQQEFITGLLYYDPSRPSYAEAAGCPRTPLASLPTSACGRRPRRSSACCSATAEAGAAREARRRRRDAAGVAGAAAGRVPTPLVDTHLAFAWARTVMVATRLGVFEALSSGPERAERGRDAAARRRADTAPARRAHRHGVPPPRRRRVATRWRVARRWLTRSLAGRGGRQGALRLRRVGASSSTTTATSSAASRSACTRWLGRSGPRPPRVATGRPSDGRGSVATAADRRRLGALPARPARPGHGLEREVARRTPVPAAPRALLDLGGAHGALRGRAVRRHRALRATVLDLPEAVAASAPLLAANGLGERLTHRVGDALTATSARRPGTWCWPRSSPITSDDDSNRRLARRSRGRCGRAACTWSRTWCGPPTRVRRGARGSERCSTSTSRPPAAPAPSPSRPCAPGRRCRSRAAPERMDADPAGDGAAGRRQVPLSVGPARRRPCALARALEPAPAETARRSSRCAGRGRRTSASGRMSAAWSRRPARIARRRGRCVRLRAGRDPGAVVG
jgi:hypothetical protein